MTAIPPGPLAIPVAPLLLCAAILAAIAVAKRIGPAAGNDMAKFIWITLAASLLAARTVFVALHFAQYRIAPAGIFDIRDGGLSAVGGVLTALAIVAWSGWKGRERRRPLAAATAVWLSVWIGGTAAMDAFADGPSSLPPLVLTRLDGGKVSLDSFAGKPVVVNLWATWCPPCRREMPILQNAQAHTRDVAFVFVDQGQVAAEIHRYLDSQQLGIQNVLLDPEMALGRIAGSGALPTTLFFRADGTLAERHIGALSAATLADQLDLLQVHHAPVRPASTADVTNH